MLSKILFVSCMLSVCVADLRFASQPRQPGRNGVNNLSNSYKVQQRTSVRFVTTVNQGEALYMEPSAFGYAGLAAQRRNAYDNFLRSNIDNEQDKRNFNNEPGKDHLPFRSYEAAATAQESGNTVQTKLPANKAIEATPGQAFNIPLRWNNPHASELEVNIWMLDNKVVVPIRKPTCSGEGHKNNVFEFVVPSDFNQLSTKVKGFNGCNQVGDCVLQVYAHSVESRMYSQGTPLIVKTTMAPAGDAAKDIANLPEPAKDPALDLSGLRDFCLPSNDASANIQSAEPQKARQVSDVYNHAYQNSDYSPYAGQQANLISKNMQASVILKMVTGNRGELGKSLLTNTQKTVQKQIEAQGQQVIKRLEGQTNRVINNLLQNQDRTQDTTSMENGQTSANCFRCAEKGATNTRRLNTNTYVPSFQIPQNLIAQSKNLVSSQYRNTLIDSQGRLQIYTTALKLMQPAMARAARVGLGYLGPRIKADSENKATLADATSFRKRNAANRRDGGVYATQQAYSRAPAENVGNRANIPVTANSINWGNGNSFQAQDEDEEFKKEAEAIANGAAVLPEADDAEGQMDPNGWGYDSQCNDEGEDDENPSNDPKDCKAPAQLFYGVDADNNLLFRADDFDPNAPVDPAPVDPISPIGPGDIDPGAPIGLSPASTLATSWLFAGIAMVFALLQM